MTDQPIRSTPHPPTKGEELVREYRDAGSGIVWEPKKLAEAIDRAIRQAS